MTVAEELDVLINSVNTQLVIPAQKRYWLNRTKSGDLYETFVENGIITLDHHEISLFQLNEYRKEYGQDLLKINLAIKAEVRKIHEEEFKIDSLKVPDTRTIGRVSAQIFRFYFEMRKGDVVIIPSSGSDIISFGTIQEDYIADLKDEQKRKIGIYAPLVRRVRWNKHIRRKELDPYLYRMFTAQQALNEVTHYSEIIERSLKDFFIIENEAHLILNVTTEDRIPASHLFGLGSEILRLVDEFSALHNLGISSEDLEVTLNLNSPGKIDLKSKIKKTTVVTGLILMVCGGGYESAGGTKFKTDGISTLIKAVDDFITHQHERDMKSRIFNQYKDSLKIKNPEDMIEVLKQFSENKDNPK